MKRTDSTGNRLHDLAYIYRGNQLISFHVTIKCTKDIPMMPQEI